MLDFALIDNDLAIDDAGDFILINNTFAIQQMILCALNLFIGEYEYNNKLGISWVIAMEAGYVQVPLILYQIKTTINNLNVYITQPELQIIEISNIQSNLNKNRELSISLIVTLRSGINLEINTNV